MMNKEEENLEKVYNKVEQKLNLNSWSIGKEFVFECMKEYYKYKRQEELNQ